MCPSLCRRRLGSQLVDTRQVMNRDRLVARYVPQFAGAWQGDYLILFETGADNLNSA